VPGNTEADETQAETTTESPAAERPLSRLPEYFAQERAIAFWTAEILARADANRKRIRKARARRPIPPRTRLRVLERDDFRCQVCGQRFDPDLPVLKGDSDDRALDALMVEMKLVQYDIGLEVDHITPVSQGGANDMDNLQTLCRDCNRGKAARRLDRHKST
jgi:5-methylcytosine-specific restriction endonuclease McrA